MLQKNPKVSLTWSLTKCQPHPRGYIWPKVSLTQRSDKNVNLTQSLTYGRYIWPEVNLTKVVTHLATRCLPEGTSDQRSVWPKGLTKMSTWPKALPMGGYVWPEVNLTKVVTHLATRCLPEGTSDQRSVWPKGLTKMSTWPKALSMGGMSDKRSTWPK